MTDKKLVDVVQYNAITGNVASVRMFEHYPNGDIIEVTPGAPERAWERARMRYGFISGCGLREVDPEKLRRKRRWA